MTSLPNWLLLASLFLSLIPTSKISPIKTENDIGETTIRPTEETTSPTIEDLPQEVSEALSVDDLFSLDSFYSSISGYEYRHASSYDIDGGNLDGFYFSKQEFIANETTLLETTGPGVITRFWMAGYAQHAALQTLTISIDGKILVDTMATDFYSGKVNPFIKPYVGIRADTGGGVYCSVPIVFKESIKITSKYLNYYNIDYVMLPVNSQVTSTTITETPIIPSWLAPASHLLGDNSVGTITKDPSFILEPGEKKTIVEKDGSGVLEGINLNIEHINDGSITCPPISTNGRWVKPGGHLEFQMDINPENQGAIFKYRVDGIWANQVSEVYIDDAKVGKTSTGITDPSSRIKDSFLQIPASFTQGKNKVKIRVEAISVDGPDIPYLDMWLFSVIPGGTILSDYLDVGTSLNESNHSFSILSESGNGTINPNESVSVFSADLLNYPFQDNGSPLPKSEQSGSFTTNVSFDIKVSGTEDAKLIKRGQDLIDATFNVWVAGKRVGIWNVFKDETELIKESSFLIPASYLSGLMSARVILVPTRGTGSISSLFVYEGSSLLDRIVFATDETHNIKGPLAYADVAYSGANSLRPKWQKTLEAIRSSVDYNSYVQDTIVRVFYGGKATPDIETSLAIFLNMGSFNYYKVQGVMRGVTDDETCYFYLPMPYNDGVKVELERDAGASGSMTIVPSYSIKALAEPTDHLQLLKTQTNYVPSTKKGTPLTWLSASGSGRLVSLQYNIEGSSSFEFCEGDEIIYIDGSDGMSNCGTGTEDIVNSAWYFADGLFTQALHGLTTKKFVGTNRAQVAFYRDLLTESVTFRNGIDATIEHGPQNASTGETSLITCFYYHYGEACLQRLGTYSAYDENSDFTVTEGTSEETSLSGRLEGNKIGQSVSSGARYLEGTSEMELSIPHDNEGLLIRRCFSLEKLDQAAAVSCDDAVVGTWMMGKNRGDETIAEYEDFIIPSSFTKGKSKVKIAFSTLAGHSWMESNYEIFALGFDLDMDSMLPDYDKDGIPDIKDPETIFKGNGISIRYSYEETIEASLAKKASSLTEDSVKALQKTLGSAYRLNQKFNLSLTVGSLDYQFGNDEEFLIEASLNGKANVAIVNPDGTFSLCPTKKTTAGLSFRTDRGGEYVIMENI